MLKSGYVQNPHGSAMEISSRKMAILLTACIVLTLATSSLARAQEYIPGLRIFLEDAPDTLFTGQTYTMQVRVTKPVGTAVSGRLRTYLYASTGQVVYPLPDEGFTYVPVNEGEWVPNEIYVTLGENVTDAIYTFNLTVRSDLRFASGSTAQAKLRARFRQTGANITIAPDSDKDVTLQYAVVAPLPSYEMPFFVKAMISVIAAIAIFAAVVFLALRGRGGESQEYIPV